MNEKRISKPDLQRADTIAWEGAAWLCFGFIIVLASVSGAATSHAKGFDRLSDLLAYPALVGAAAILVALILLRTAAPWPGPPLTLDTDTSPPPDCLSPSLRQLVADLAGKPGLASGTRPARAVDSCSRIAESGSLAAKRLAMPPDSTRGQVHGICQHGTACGVRRDDVPTCPGIMVPLLLG